MAGTFICPHKRRYGLFVMVLIHISPVCGHSRTGTASGVEAAFSHRFPACACHTVICKDFDYRYGRNRNNAQLGSVQVRIRSFHPGSGISSSVPEKHWKQRAWIANFLLLGLDRYFFIRLCSDLTSSRRANCRFLSRAFSIAVVVIFITASVDFD